MVLINIIFLYILISKHTIQQPIHIVKNQNNISSNNRNNIVISGKLATIFLQEIFNKKISSNNCILILSLNQLKVFISQAFCYIPFIQYIQTTKIGSKNHNNNEKDFYLTVPTLHYFTTNVIEFLGRKFRYSIERNTIFINTNKTPEERKEKNELVFCTKNNIDKPLENIPPLSTTSRKILRYLSKIEVVCLHIYNKEFNIFIKFNYKTSKFLFKDIIQIQPKTILKKVSRNKYYLDLIENTGLIVFLERYKNYCLIRFSYNLSAANIYEKVTKAIKNMKKYNNLLYLNNISLIKLIEYLSTFIQFNSVNLKKTKLEYKIYGILRW